MLQVAPESIEPRAAMTLLSPDNPELDSEGPVAVARATSLRPYSTPRFLSVKHGRIVAVKRSCRSRSTFRVTGRVAARSASPLEDSAPNQDCRFANTPVICPGFCSTSRLPSRPASNAHNAAPYKDSAQALTKRSKDAALCDVQHLVERSSKQSRQPNASYSLSRATIWR